MKSDRLAATFTPACDCLELGCADWVVCKGECGCKICAANYYPEDYVSRDPAERPASIRCREFPERKKCHGRAKGG